MDDRMNEWKRLDLVGKERPKPGRLVILYKRDITADRPGEYEAGRFFQEGRKLWWKSASGVWDPAKMRRRKDIWWRYEEPCTVGGDFDEREG